jgi:hypothetical protein
MVVTGSGDGDPIPLGDKEGVGNGVEDSGCHSHGALRAVGGSKAIAFISMTRFGWGS